MNITYITSGNILTDESKAIVIPINTMGIAGTGLALKWRIQYPDEHRLCGIVCNRYENSLHIDYGGRREFAYDHIAPHLVSIQYSL